MALQIGLKMAHKLQKHYPKYHTEIVKYPVPKINKAKYFLLIMTKKAIRIITKKNQTI